jgi:hypothetical protein
LPARIAIVLLSLCAVGALLFVLFGSVSSGDLYSEYSTLRTDRDGSSALYEALERIQPVKRNFTPLADLHVNGSTVMILNTALGVKAAKTGNDDGPALPFLKTCEALARQGNRVVIALNAEQAEVALGSWHLNMWRKKNADNDDYPLLPLYFDVGPEWTIYRRNKDGADIVERPFGAGSVGVFAAPGAFANGSLREHRDSRLVKWALGDKSPVIFDESHLGSVERGGVMSLIRQFRLQGVLGVVLLCAVLLFWQASFPFPPPAETSTRDDAVLQGPATVEGLQNLLSHHIAPAKLMPACVAEWRHDRGRRVRDEAFGRIEKIAGSAGNPVGQWKEIRQVISEKESA